MISDRFENRIASNMPVPFSLWIHIRTDNIPFNPRLHRCEAEEFLDTGNIKTSFKLPKDLKLYKNHTPQIHYNEHTACSVDCDQTLPTVRLSGSPD